MLYLWNIIPLRKGDRVNLKVMLKMQFTEICCPICGLHKPLFQHTLVTCPPIPHCLECMNEFIENYDEEEVNKQITEYNKSIGVE